MKVHFFDWRWQDPATAMIQAVHNGKIGKKSVKIGDLLSFKVDSGPTCAGGVVAGQYSPCASAYTESKAKCQLCRSREGSFVYTVFDGFNTDNIGQEDLQKIKGEHWVYLALFNETTLKIGVSKESRKVMRQIEQGSHATAYIARTPDGITARQIETLVRKSGIQDKIQASQKKNELLPTITDEVVKKTLQATMNTAKAALADHQSLLDFFLPLPEICFWQKNYQIPAGSLHYLPMALQDSVSGVVKGMKGSFLVLDVAGEIVSVDMKKLRGKVIDFSPRVPGITTEAARQGALF